MASLTSCGTEEDSQTATTEEPTETTSTRSPPAEIPFAAERNLAAPQFDKPEDLCGLDGFKYLLTVYFYPQCHDCHGPGDFATADADKGFERILKFTPETLRQVITSGQFCTGDCRLEEGDPLLGEIDLWLDDMESCPSS